MHEQTALGSIAHPIGAPEGLGVQLMRLRVHMHSLVCPPPGFLPNRCTSLKAAWIYENASWIGGPHSISRQISSRIPIAPNCLKNKTQFTEARLPHFVRKNICCPM